MITYFSFIIFMFVAMACCEFCYGFNRIKSLKTETEQRRIDKQAQPLVSIIICARNEAANITNTIKSIQQQTYKPIEIVFVDDRSEDGTYETANKLAEQVQNIKVYRIISLPSGWLGKNHAMYYGAQKAKGEWLLFIDADVTFAPETIERSFRYIYEKKIDNLTVYPKVQGESFWLDVMINVGFVAFFLQQKPWKASLQTKKYYAGVGAFNLMKKNDYQRCGGHKLFPLCTIDDLKLGKCLKQLGIKQTVLDGYDLVRVPWYRKVSEMIVGLEKNTYTYCRYRITNLVFQTLMGLTFYIYPIVGLFWSTTTNRIINGATIFVTIWMYNYYTSKRGLSFSQNLMYPIGLFLGLIACWRAAIKIHFARGLSWRGTFYPLKSLKKDLL